MKQKWIRLIPFFAILLMLTTIIISTNTRITDHIKLGLDLKGGFEILYLAKPVDSGGTVTTQALRETAKSLIRRIDPTGTMEPEINPEGDRIRVRIAGVVQFGRFAITPGRNIHTICRGYTRPEIVG